MSSKPVPLVSPESFDRAESYSRMSASSVRLAYQVLVEGTRQTVVAERAGVSPQWVNQAVARMRGYIAKAHPLPPNWKAAMVSLPNEQWPTVHAMEKAARAALLKQDVAPVKRPPSKKGKNSRGRR